MYDSYDGTAIPGGAAMVAGYPWWPQESWNRFRGKPELLIVTSASDNRGDVLDCEPGDAEPYQAEGWIRMRKAAGYFRPTIYCGESNYSAVRAGTGGYRLGIDYDIWIAFWNGSPTFFGGAVAHQYYNAPSQAFDLSVVWDSGWPHRTDAKPKPPPIPASPYRQVADGTKSLATVAEERNTSFQFIARETVNSYKIRGKITKPELTAFLNYYDYPVKKEGAHHNMPKGLVYYTEHG